MPRIKVQLPTLLTRDDAESTMRELAIALNAQRAHIVERDSKVLAINKTYESALATLDESIKVKTDSLRAWAESNPDVFPKGRKSLDLVCGVLGFRTGTPKLSLLSRAFNWERVLALVKQLWPAFIRIKEEVDKEGILSMHSQAEDKSAADAELKRLGLKVVQDESFFIEPDLTDLDARQSAAT
jgi:phage host-nuclease inhibitor protein Gam